MRTDHVEQAQRGEPRRPSFSFFPVWPLRRRTGGSETPTDGVGADDVETVRIDRFPRSDEIFPPPFTRGDVRAHTVPTGSDVGRGRETGVEEDGVGTVGVEVAPGFVGDGVVG